MQKFFKTVTKIFLFSILCFNFAYAADITGSGNEITEDSSVLQNINGNDTELTIKNSATLERGNNPIKTNTHLRATIVVESGATVSTSTGSNAIQAIDAGKGLSITNSGTVKAANSKAINLTDVEEGTLTNNSGGIIQANTNTISMLESDGDTTDNITINNSGTIFATDNSNVETNTIKTDDDSTNITINNNSGGHIYHTSAGTVIMLGGSATLNNSGKIENKDGPNEESITMSGSAGAEVNLNDGGLVIGTIRITGSGHKLNVKHGPGQGYYYETAGNGTYEVKDKNKNPIVKGSAGSVGQGSNETLDETLSYKSLNIRKSLTRFNKNDEYSDQDETWAEIFSSFQKRKEKSGILRLSNETIGVGANIINPISRDKNLIVSVETGLQKFSKDHDVNKLSISTGLHFEKIKINNNINSELYFLAGIGYNKSERQILTNTTTSGRLDITDSYLNYDFLIGNKINFNQSLPDLGFNLGYSYTPSHKESKYYIWEDKHIFNGSVSLSDEYEIVKDKQKKFYLSWIADARTVIDENVQVFYVAGAKGDYSQDHDLKEEYSLSAGINYEYAFSKDNIFLLTLDALQTSQFTSGLQANLNYNIKF